MWRVPEYLASSFKRLQQQKNGGGVWWSVSALCFLWAMAEETQVKVQLGTPETLLFLKVELKRIFSSNSVSHQTLQCHQ